MAALVAGGTAGSTDNAFAHCAKKKAHHGGKGAKKWARRCKRRRAAAAYSNCPLRRAGSTIGTDLILKGCRTVVADSAAGRDPRPLWGTIECATAARHAWSGAGGDAHPTASGAGQGNASYRRLSVFDGDNFWGERCELGRNEHRGGDFGSTFALYREGQRRATFMSFRLPPNFPLDANAWQVVMQMKQTQPSAAGGGSPMIELDAYGGRWRLFQGPDSREIWSAPAEAGAWTRFAFDVVYSRDAAIGSISVHADLNGDGDAADSGERSGVIHAATLKAETSGGSAADGIAPGQSIPSHLRTGVYHNPTIACPAPSGCAADVDNVQVLGT